MLKKEEVVKVMGGEDSLVFNSAWHWVSPIKAWFEKTIFSIVEQIYI